MKDKSDQEWQSILTPEQYRICREGGTEPAFSGELLYNKETGDYKCGCCGATLFNSESKYDSGSGWPSFFKPHRDKAILEREDRRHGMIRKEVLCSQCHAHLGHVFKDGPEPTGLRYCLNSAALKFEKKP